MRAFLCIAFPPLACLMAGRPGAAFLNLFLCMFGWLPGIVHAFAVCNGAVEVGYHKDQMRALREQKEMMMMQIEIQQMQHMQRMASDGADVMPHLRKRKRR
jgi:uncharacterized membrane protein YqaE (UPF0057 family)